MDSKLIKTQLVKELGDHVIRCINDMKNDNRSSFLEPICYHFHNDDTVRYYSNNKVPELYNNWQVFNNREWELICKFDENALGREYRDTIKKHRTSIDIEYKLCFNGSETVEEVLKTIEQHPSYGYFEGIKLLHGWTYELMWGT